MVASLALTQIGSDSTSERPTTIFGYGEVQGRRIKRDNKSAPFASIAQLGLEQRFSTPMVGSSNLSRCSTFRTITSILCLTVDEGNDGYIN